MVRRFYSHAFAMLSESDDNVLFYQFPFVLKADGQIRSTCRKRRVSADSLISICGSRSLHRLFREGAISGHQADGGMVGKNWGRRNACAFLLKAVSDLD